MRSSNLSQALSWLRPQSFCGQEEVHAIKQSALDGPVSFCQKAKKYEGLLNHQVELIMLTLYKADIIWIRQKYEQAKLETKHRQRSILASARKTLGIPGAAHTIFQKKKNCIIVHRLQWCKTKSILDLD